MSIYYQKMILAGIIGAMCGQIFGYSGIIPAFILGAWIGNL